MNISYDLTIHYMSEISYPVKLVIDCNVYLSSRTVPSLGQSAGSLSQSIHLNLCLFPPPTPSITFKCFCELTACILFRITSFSLAIKS